MRVASEFALSHSELNEISHHNALKMIKQAAKIVYQTKKYGSRGEFGEILLHIAIQQVYIKKFQLDSDAREALNVFQEAIEKREKGITDYW